MKEPSQDGFFISKKSNNLDMRIVLVQFQYHLKSPKITPVAILCINWVYLPFFIKYKSSFFLFYFVGILPIKYVNGC